MVYQRNRAGTNWWDATYNPVGGCLPVSRGCRNCYAAKIAATQQTAHRIPLYLGTTRWTQERPVFNGRLTALAAGHHEWTFPLRWEGAEHPVMGDGQPSLIFVVDMGDLFHEHRAAADIDRTVGTMVWSRHIGQFLTRRPSRMAEYFGALRSEKTRDRWQRKLWLGISAEGQNEFDERWAHMRQLAESGWTVFVSVAPMLEPVRLPADFLTLGRRAWVIASGQQERGGSWMDPDWARALRDQCAGAGVPFFLLQMSGRKPIPADLFVRQFPAVRFADKN